MKKEGGEASRGTSRPEKIMRAAGVLLWIGLIGIFLLNRDRITVESILEKTPRDPWEAVPLMLLFFGIKGNRWEKVPRYAQLFNEHWIHPLASDTIANTTTIEGAAYW